MAFKLRKSFQLKFWLCKIIIFLESLNTDTYTIHVQYNIRTVTPLFLLSTQGCCQVCQGQEHPGQRQGLHGQGAGGRLSHHPPALHEVLSALRKVTGAVGRYLLSTMDLC